MYRDKFEKKILIYDKLIRNQDCNLNFEKNLKLKSA